MLMSPIMIQIDTGLSLIWQAEQQSDSVPSLNIQPAEYAILSLVSSDQGMPEWVHSPPAAAHPKMMIRVQTIGTHIRPSDSSLGMLPHRINNPLCYSSQPSTSSSHRSRVFLSAGSECSLFITYINPAPYYPLCLLLSTTTISFTKSTTS